MKTTFEILEDLRTIEDMIQRVRWEVIDSEFYASNSERLDLMNKIYSIVAIAEQAKDNLYNYMK